MQNRWASQYISPIGNIYESLQTLWLEAFLLEYAKILSNFGGEDAKSSNENGKASRNSDRPNQRTEPLGLVRQNPDQTYALSVLAWGAESWLLLRLHIAGMVSGDPAQPQTGAYAELDLLQTLERGLSDAYTLFHGVVDGVKQHGVNVLLKTQENWKIRPEIALNLVEIMST